MASANRPVGAPVWEDTRGSAQRLIAILTQFRKYSQVGDLDFSPATQAVLDRFGFDRQTFFALRSRFASDPAGFKNAVMGEVAAPGPTDLVRAAPPGTDQFRHHEKLGLQAIAAGQVAIVVLAGGMATRFGGAVKAVVEVTDGRSFLDLKLAEIANTARVCNTTLDVFVMTSFATDDEIKRRLAQQNPSRHLRVEPFAQFVSVRIRPDASIFRTVDGQPSLYAPGHGDLTFALRQSGLLSKFRAAGGRYLMVSNVDNLAAVCEPAILGAHIDGGCAMTVEVVDKHADDKGGAPARLDGRLQIIEEFRFPPSFDQDAIPVFNTNTFLMDAEAIDRDFALDWFAARKTVGDEPVVQFERLMGQLTAFLPARFLRVPRGGSHGRFLPVKDPDELARRLPDIRSVLEPRGGLG